MGCFLCVWGYATFFEGCRLCFFLFITRFLRVHCGLPWALWGRFWRGKGSIVLCVGDLRRTIPIFGTLNSSVHVQLVRALLRRRRVGVGRLTSDLKVAGNTLADRMGGLRRSKVLTVLPRRSNRKGRGIYHVGISGVLISVTSGGSDPTRSDCSVSVPVNGCFGCSICPAYKLSAASGLVNRMSSPHCFTRPDRMSTGVL